MREIERSNIELKAIKMDKRMEGRMCKEKIFVNQVPFLASVY